jgi:hypothetical protein
MISSNSFISVGSQTTPVMAHRLYTMESRDTRANAQQKYKERPLGNYVFDNNKQNGWMNSRHAVLLNDIPRVIGLG